MAFVARSGRQERRVYLDLGDSAGIDAEALAWSDVTGKVNIEPDDGDRDGIYPIGPTFGVRLGSGVLTTRALVSSYDRSRWRDPAYNYHFLRGVVEYERRRTTIETYCPAASDPDYAFYVSWPWRLYPEVNSPRATFIEACRSEPGLEFDGGFVRRRRNDLPQWRALETPRRYAIQAYLANTSRSVVSFSNPAVHGCLGWKLGEFLALGKAIVSLPLDRVLPAPLETGVHIHEVDGSSESMADAISRIRRDEKYRRALETNAHQWFVDNLEPVTLTTRLLQRVGVDI
jgi:hypothetical protein